MKTRIAIAGYGNMGKAAIENLKHFPDMELTALISRRPLDIKIDVPVYNYEQLDALKEKVDVAILCGGSAKDLPLQSPALAERFNIVDSFDTHQRIPEHFEKVDKAAKNGGNLALISSGWDPGLFSFMRAVFGAVLPNGTDYTFWGKGVSQGHSDALRRINGVKKAIQYTIPKDEALKKVRSGNAANLTVKEKHLRECYIVAEENADKARMEKDIITMPDYFAPYDTVVHFIDENEFDSRHTALPHGGFVLRSGKTDAVTNHLIEFSIKLDSNPQFTSSILLAYARAVKRLADEGKTGALTVFDVAPKYLSLLTDADLRKNLL